ncbi:MAG: glycosyltransferase 87 family protein [Halioglobus sp.]
MGFKPHPLIYRLALIGAFCTVSASIWLSHIYGQNLFSDSLHFGNLVILQFSVLAACMFGAWWSAPESAGANTFASVRTLLMVGIACRLILLPLEHYTSNDMDRYLFDGKIALSGMDPYSINHNAPELAHLKEQWAPPEEHTQYPTLYPPAALGLFTLAAAADANLAPLAWKGLATAAGILTLIIMAYLLQALGKLRHLPLIALSPILILETGIGVHVDAYSALFVAAALYAYHRHSLRLTGVFIGLATLVKLLPILLLAPLVLGQKSLRSALTLGTSALVIILLGYSATFALGLIPIGSIGTLFEKWRFGSPLFSLLAASLPGMQQTLVVSLIALAGLAIIAYRALRLPTSITLDSPLLIASMALILVLSPVIFPWYLMALVPMAAVAPRPFLLVWLCTLPFTYEVLGAFYAQGDWQPAQWPLLLIGLGFATAAVWEWQLRETPR